MPLLVTQADSKISGLILALFLFLWTWASWPVLTMDVRNAHEAAVLWSDEGRHIRTLEKMKSEKTLELLHPAYTGGYPNLSFLVTTVVEWWPLSEMNPVITGSRITSWGCSILMLGTVFLGVWRLFGHWGWGLVAVLLTGTHRWIRFFAVTLHPEPPMLAGITIALVSGAFYLRNPRFHYLGWMAAGSALAIGSKLQALMLIPWMAVIGLTGLWKSRQTSAQVVITWGMGALGIFLGGLLLITPWQLLHPQRLWEGIQSERNFQSMNHLGVTEWLEYITSNELLGIPYSLLLSGFIAGMLFQCYRTSWNLRIWLDKPENALFFGSLLWVCVSMGHVILSVNVLIARYVTHAVPALMLMLTTGLFRARNSRWPKGLQAMILLLLILGLQQQAKHTQRDFDRRLQMSEKIAGIRQVMNEIQHLVPHEAVILSPRLQFIESSIFPKALGMEPTESVIRETRPEFLLLPDDYLRLLRKEGVAEKIYTQTPEYVTKAQFWHKLREHGFYGQFRVYRSWPEANITLYQRNHAD
ncbi:MAG: hypothetical protein HQM11_15820 [SAR324 cluster bacterium]|nr:hypothetical protein [SAR324 cluster bacterium]